MAVSWLVVCGWLVVGWCFFMLPVSGSSPGSLTIPGAEMFPTQADGHTPSLGSNAKEKALQKLLIKKQHAVKGD